VKAKLRILAFTSLFPFHLMIIYIIFAHTSLYVIVLQVGKICVLDLPIFIILSQKATVALYFGKKIRTRLGVVHFQVFRFFL